MIELPPLPQGVPQSLSQARVLHTQCLTRLQAYAESEGIGLVHAEGYVMPHRRVSVVEPSRHVIEADDAVHMGGSLHYLGLARDHVVYRAGADGKLQPVTDGGDPVWRQLGEYWKSLHPSCRWGGDFPTVDANHFSIAWAGKG